MKPRPALFVGSSTEGLPIAQALQVLLDYSCEVEVWSQGVFGLSQGGLESLVLALDRFDFAVLVLSADDLVRKRGETLAAPRDNVLFELGLFTGGLGRERTYMLYERSKPPELPTDLAGITAATFELHSSGNLEAALGAAATRIQQQIQRLGLRERREISRLAHATNAVEGVGASMQKLIHLLARSRRNELDIISAQFGPLIDRAKLADMKKDLEEFERTLKDEVAANPANRADG